MSQNKVIRYSVIMSILLLVAACQEKLRQPSRPRQVTTVSVTMTSFVPMDTQVMPTKTSQPLSHTLFPTVSIVPTPIIQSEDSVRAVLAYGYDKPSTGLPWAGCDSPDCFAIPELLVYEDGLVLFACRDEGWPKVCQNYVSSERIVRLLDDLAAADFFGKYRIYPPNVGPHSSYYVAASTEEVYGVTRWSGSSHYGSPVPESFSSMRKTVETFLDQVRVDSQLHWPEYAVIWVKGCQCPPPIDAWSEEEGKYLGLYSYCDDLDSLPEWPFEFRLTDESLDDWQVFEFLQPVSDITSVIPDMTCPIDFYARQSSCDFRDGDSVLSIKIRPYLRGETVPTGGLRDRWTHTGQVVLDRLPLYSTPCIPIVPTLLPQPTVAPEASPTYPWEGL